MANRPSLDDYVDVAERIQDFKDAHPEGSLQTLGWELVTVRGVDPKGGKETERTFVVYRAAAFRHPEDPSPGHGIAWEPWPGGTPYTKDSELMNAETAAWGRAIVALGLVANRRLASRQEVRNRTADAEAEEEIVERVKREFDATELVNEDVIANLRAIHRSSGWDGKKLQLALVQVGIEDAEDIPAAMAALTIEQAVLLGETMGGSRDDVLGGAA